MNSIVMNIAFLFSTLIFFFTSHLAYSKKDRTGKMLGRAIIFSSMVILSYGLVFFFPNEIVVNIAMGIARICILGACVSVFFFVAEYTQLKLIKEYLLVGLSLAAVDALVILSNPINHFVGTFSVWNENGIVWANFQPQFMAYFHVLVCLSFILQAIGILIYKAFHTSFYLRTKYDIITITLILVVVMELWYIADERSKIDYSLFTYGIASIIAYVLTYKFAPRHVNHMIQGIIDDSIDDATLIYDGDGNIVRINRVAREIISKEIWSDLSKIIEFFGIENDDIIKKEINGNVYRVHTHHLSDKKQRQIATVVVLRDITENERLLEREHIVATTDTLTQIPNRLGFFEEARKFVNDNQQAQSFTMIVGGIVDFKGINSLYGTEFGDKLLKGIAIALSNYSANNPMAYGRSAEGKFACLVLGEDSYKVSEDLKHYRIAINSDSSFSTELCFGYVEVKDKEKPLDYYYERANLALAVAKKSNTSNYIEYTSDMEEAVSRRQFLVSQMHSALEKKEFFLNFQPQIDLNSNKVSGIEALVRWKHSILGIVSPAEFIPLFESNGFISKLDTFVWRETAKTAVKMKKEGIYDGPFSVNVSQVDITSLDVVAVFEEIVSETGVEKERLHIEITESACVNNRSVLIDTMNRLRKSGFILEIDDFGSGYSSLNALMDLPFDAIKLDMGFMRGNNIAENGEIIISSIVQMVHNLGAGVIVEGIETPENLRQTIKLTGNVGQGFYFSKPLSYEDLQSFVMEHNDGYGL